MIQQENRFTCQGLEKVCPKHYVCLCKESLTRKLNTRQYLNQQLGTAALHVHEGAGLRRGRGWEGYSATTFSWTWYFRATGYMGNV